jgi:hypothetical protein
MSKISISQTKENFNELETRFDNCLKNPPEIIAWIRFLQEIGLNNALKAIPDQRQSGKITYDLSSLLQWAISIYAFRLGSKNAFQTSINSLTQNNCLGVCKLLNTNDNKIPHSSTVDYALSGLPIEVLSSIPLKLLKLLEKKKFFYNHPELLPNNSLQIGIDGFWLHRYNIPHSCREDGSNACPYCLQRTQHKGKSKEVTYWVHVVVTVVLICDGITLPILFYPLKAAQINSEQSDEKLKEECELKAAHAILPMIREYFPKTHIIFLGDALYANRPTIRLCELLKMDYLIVLKETTLKTLNARCDQLASTELYQRYYNKKSEEVVQRKRVEQRVSWFNHAEVGEDVFTNVLRYCEIGVYKGSWICSKKITSENCCRLASTGRMRWQQEDFHNTAKNRGFNMKHDIARANPNLLFVWKAIGFIAYFISELFLYTSVAVAARKSRSFVKFVRDMLQQLIDISWETLSQSPMLTKAKVQFRYCFKHPP